MSASERPSPEPIEANPMPVDELRRLLRVSGGGVSVRALLTLAFQESASAEDLAYADALMRSNGWRP